MSSKEAGTPLDIDFGELELDMDFGSDDLTEIFAEIALGLTEEDKHLFEPQKQHQSAPDRPTPPKPAPAPKMRGNGSTVPVTLRLPLVLLDWLKSEAKRQGLRGYQTLLVRLLQQSRRNSR